MSIGENLKAFRTARKLSMRAVGEAIGVHFTTIDKLERGKMQLSADRLLKLASFFGVPTSDVTGEYPAQQNVSLQEVIELLRNASIPADIRAAAAAEKLSQMMEGGR